MKRSGLGPGARSLERGSTFARPKSSLTRRHRKQALTDPTFGEGWRFGWQEARCVMCGARRPEAHHAIPRQRLRSRAAELGLDADRLLGDRRNRLWLCGQSSPRGRNCHAAHHARMTVVPWETLVRHAPKVVQFARELELLPWLERMYPKTNNEKE